MLTIDPKKVPVKKTYGLMVSAVGPRPIAFASTVNEKGEPNLAPFSFFNVFSANPPILVFSPVLRIKDDSEKHTLENVKNHKEVVINIVNYDMVQQMSLASTDYADGINEFEKTGLTMQESEVVKPFRVKESPVQFECKVNEVKPLGDKGGAGNLVICEVLRIHVSEDVLAEGEKIDQHKLDQVARMGGNLYSRANMGVFEIPKPQTTLGIGVDNIPQSIRTSTILTGNDLGKLGNVENIPDETEITEFLSENKLVDYVKESSEEKIHAIAQEYLKKEEVMSAWKILLAKNK
ncbi:flavin reductase (DIM6/NTAB) family NADH-FMN oxidoreductase RutF [Mesonia algae]|uniref:Flavin reductase (DIM6/NTAB) family NADH-FMN oxidoreductase RutF n=1 Tax=Mesonia algae TaxID=213248 RepID=A0A2W7IAC4_9FLAO|nr:flavin reductase family protein [Mesonia algae]PZW43856.1 flavin reductase (DIM6/NTAB) family NADH-FMN oxidoreductase RutF [Mesonia algae]